MKPEFESRRVFAITRSKGKMYEFGVASCRSSRKVVSCLNKAWPAGPGISIWSGYLAMVSRLTVEAPCTWPHVEAERVSDMTESHVSPR